MNFDPIPAVLPVLQAFAGVSNSWGCNCSCRGLQRWWRGRREVARPSHSLLALCQLWALDARTWEWCVKPHLSNQRYPLTRVEYYLSWCPELIFNPWWKISNPLEENSKLLIKTLPQVHGHALLPQLWRTAKRSRFRFFLGLRSHHRCSKGRSEKIQSTDSFCSSVKSFKKFLLEGVMRMTYFWGSDSHVDCMWHLKMLNITLWFGLQTKGMTVGGLKGCLTYCWNFVSPNLYFMKVCLFPDSHGWFTMEYLCFLTVHFRQLICCIYCLII